MKNKINKAIFLIPLLYIAAIVLLLYLQFSGSRSFNAEVVGISIDGQTRAGTPGKGNSIHELIVSYMGVDFSFSQEDPFLLNSQDGLLHKLKPTGYRVTALGIDIYLSKGITCSFYKTAAENEEMDITIKLEDPASIKNIQLPINSRKAALKTDQSISAVSITTDSNSIFCLTIPEGGFFDEEKNSVVINSAEEQDFKLRFEQSSGYGMEAFSFWKNKEKDGISSQKLLREINIYIDKSQKALTNNRFDSSNGTWAVEKNSSRFYEDALVMMASETIKANTYNSVEKLLEETASIHSKDISVKSSCLFGNIVNEVWSFNEKIKSEIPNLLKRAQNSDYSIFSEEDLITILLTENKDQLQQEILSMIKNLNKVNDYETAIAMLYFYANLYEKDPETGKKFSDISKLIDFKIIPSLTIIDNRPYITGEKSCGDIQKTLEAGIYLFKKSPTVLEETHNLIGRELVHSALTLADNSGFLPKEVRASNENEFQKTGIIRPESIYSLLTENTYYPDIDYFFLESDKTISVLNQADDFNIESTSYGYRITFDFPRFETHRFAIRNIDPFYMLYLFGGRWSSDHRFQSYSSGWWYDRQHNTLFVKINHKSKTEEIRIYKNAP